MRKIFLVLFVFMISIGVNAQWISNGESGLSVRNKLNAMKSTVDSIITATSNIIEVDSVGIDTAGIVVDSLTRFIYYNDSIDCWYTWDTCAVQQIKPGADAQIITIFSISSGRLKISNDCTQELKDGADYVMKCGDNITLAYIRNRWVEIARGYLGNSCTPIN